MRAGPAKFDGRVLGILIKLRRSGTRDSGSAKPARQASAQCFPPACLAPTCLRCSLSTWPTCLFFSWTSCAACLGSPNNDLLFLFRSSFSSFSTFSQRCFLCFLSKILTGPPIRVEAWRGIDALQRCLSRHLQPAQLSCWRRQDTTYLTRLFRLAYVCVRRSITALFLRLRRSVAYQPMDLSCALYFKQQDHTCTRPRPSELSSTFSAGYHRSSAMQPLRTFPALSRRRDAYHLVLGQASTTSPFSICDCRTRVKAGWRASR